MAEGNYADFADAEIGWDFTVAGKLGSGSYGQVFKAVDEAGREAAVKQCASDARGVPNLMEASIMASIRHPNLASSSRIAASPTKVSIYQALAAADAARATRGAPPPFETARAWCHQLAQGVRCLHEDGIVHGDIKAANALLFGREDRTARLADFTLAAKVWPGEPPLTHGVGTYSHRAPENFLGAPWGFPLDVWALGCTFFELAFGAPLFPHQAPGGEPRGPALRRRALNAILDWAEEAYGLAATLEELGRGGRTLLGAGPRPPGARFPPAAKAAALGLLAPDPSRAGAEPAANGGAEDDADPSSHPRPKSARRVGDGVSRFACEYYTFAARAGGEAPADARYEPLFDLVFRMLDPSPARRPTIAEVLADPLFDGLRRAPCVYLSLPPARLDARAAAWFERVAARHVANRTAVDLARGLYARAAALADGGPGALSRLEVAHGCLWIAAKLVLRPPPAFDGCQPHRLLAAERAVCHALNFIVHKV